MISVIVHIHNEDPVLGEIDELPNAKDMMITVKNPRKRDGKEIHYIDASVTTVIWPLHRISFIELISSETDEEIISFVRE
jgi:hypothetical protein